ncbi:MAG: hypothetical protein IJ301_04425, partial [Clostridia bacterium]|nr:hypothetical protein [Clostridia bacterium]
ADYWHFDLVPLEDSYLEVNSRFESIMRGANSILDYDFFSWFESVADSIWNFEIIPNISIGDIFSTCLGITLVFVFLRFFSGG